MIELFFNTPHDAEIYLRGFGLVFLVSAGLCGLIVKTGHLHHRLLKRREDTAARQAMHVRPTPRIGGLAVALGIGLIAVVAPVELRDKFALFALSILPVFAAGLAEDFGHRISPKGRLLAAGLASAMAVALLHVWIPRTGVPGLDWLFAWSPLAIAFTIFAGAGMTNAFNLIDGVNGLAGGTAILVALGLAAIAAQSGDVVFAQLCVLFIAAVLGFLILNFPHGRIFLGDAGAYTIGHVLGWFGIAILARLPQVSPWAILLIFFWPVADTCLAIYRRRKRGARVDSPDRLHFHQLVLRMLELRFFGRDRRHLTNPLTTVVLMPMVAAPIVAGALLYDRPPEAFLALAGFSMLFVATYGLGIGFAKAYPGGNTTLTRLRYRFST